MDVLFEETDKPLASWSLQRARPSPTISWWKKHSKAKQSQSISSKSTSFTCNSLMKNVIVCDSPKKFQVKDVLFEGTDWLCFALLFSSGNDRWWTCSLRRPTGFANERPGSDHVTWGQMRGLEKNYMKRNRQTDIATLWKNRPRVDSLKKMTN